MMEYSRRLDRRFYMVTYVILVKCVLPDVQVEYDENVLI